MPTIMKVIVSCTILLIVYVLVFTGSPLEYFNGDKPEYAVLFLHGSGADGKDLYSIAPEIESLLPDELQGKVMYSFPDGPHGRYGGYTWEKFIEGKYSYKETEKYLQAHIKKNILKKHNLLYKNILVVGFSAGGSGALYVFPFLLHGKVGGIVSISGSYLVTDQSFNGYLNTGIPVVLIHGNEDSLISVGNLTQLENAFLNSGFKVESHILKMGHEISNESIEIVSNFAKKVFK